jgi:hypothetical protein
MTVSDYKLETLRHDGEFVLYRGLAKRQNDKSPSRLLILAPVLERPAPETLRRMEHEFSLKEELDGDWAVRPLTLTQYQVGACSCWKIPAASRSIDLSESRWSWSSFCGWGSVSVQR